jgi:DNA-binding NarL/FixJ family response regulator
MSKTTVLAIGSGLSQKCKLLREEGFELRSSRSAAEGWSFFERRAPSLVILTTDAEPAASLRLVGEIRRRDRTVPLILVVTESSEDLAIAALRAGVTEYLKAPLPDQGLLDAVRACLVRAAPDGAPDFAWAGQLIGDSPHMREIRSWVGKVARTDTQVLVTGETGTGLCVGPRRDGEGMTVRPSRSALRQNRPPSRPPSRGAYNPAGPTSRPLARLLRPSGRLVFPGGVWRVLAGSLELSRRESEIVQAVFDDEKESAIAVNLGISSHTVHTHLERLYRKLGVTSRAALVYRVFVEYLWLQEDPGRAAAILREDRQDTVTRG